MRIEHVALWTRDLEKSRNFYQEFFSGKAGSKYVNPKTHFESYFIEFESGARLEIMERPDVVLVREDIRKEYIGYTHIAFSVGSKEKVDVITEKLRCNGFSVVSEPRVSGDGYYESCVLDPDQNRVEVVE